MISEGYHVMSVPCLYLQEVSDYGEIYWNLSDTKDSNQAIECYVPLCVCLVTNVPYFDVLKDALSWYVINKSLALFVLTVSGDLICSELTV